MWFDNNTEKVSHKLVHTQENFIKTFYYIVSITNSGAIAKLQRLFFLAAKAVKEMHTYFARNSSSAWKHFQEKIPIMWKNTLAKTSSGFTSTILLLNTDHAKHSLYSEGLDNKNISCERIFRCRGRYLYTAEEKMVNIMSQSITLWCIKHPDSALQNFLYIFTIIIVFLKHQC